MGRPELDEEIIGNCLEQKVNMDKIRPIDWTKNGKSLDRIAGRFLG